jgi:hypothetical protein
MNQKENLAISGDRYSPTKNNIKQANKHDTFKFSIPHVILDQGTNVICEKCMNVYMNKV